MAKIIQRLINLKNKKFVKDASILQLGSIFSTGLGFLASIVYARALGVEGYASYALIFAFVGLMSIFMNLGTNQSALTIMAEAYAEGNKEKIRDVLTYYLKITILVTVVVGLIIIFIAPLITSSLYNSAEIGHLARVIVLSYMVKIFFGMYIIVLQVVRKIKYLTLIENANKIIYVFVPVALVLLGYGLTGLVVGHLITAVAFAIYTIFAYRRLCRHNDLFPSWRDIVKNALSGRSVHYFKFGFLIAIDKNLGSLYTILPIFILGIFNFEAVAHFKIASAYAGLALLLLGPVARLLSVQLPQSKSYGWDILKRDFIRSAVGSFFLTLAISIFLAGLAWFLIPFVYGQEYLFSISLAYPLLIGSVISGLGVGLSSAFRTLSLMRQSIIINTCFVLGGAASLYWIMSIMPISGSIYFIAFWLPAVTVFQFFYLLPKFGKVKSINS